MVSYTLQTECDMDGARTFLAIRQSSFTSRKMFLRLQVAPVRLAKSSISGLRPFSMQSEKAPCVVQS